MNRVGEVTSHRAPLYLTFDDGPDPAWTPAVLELLDGEGVQATFFVLGGAVRQNPSVLAEIIEAGHRIELHGDAHLDHRAASEAELERDTTAALQTLSPLGIQPTWWRLPWGRPGPATAGQAAARELRIVGWDVDTHDWRGDRPSDQGEQFDLVAETGGVVLLHDGCGPGAQRASVANTLELTHALITRARTHGTSLSALPDPAATSLSAVPSGAGPSSSTAAAPPLITSGAPQ